MVDDYKTWWLKQFPCECGHSPDDHFLAPENGKCRSCIKCHGEFGGIALYGQEITKAVEVEENNEQSQTE